MEMNMKIKEGESINDSKLAVQAPKGKLIVKVYENNPFEKLEIGENGLITGATESFGFETDKNAYTGESESSKLGIAVAQIVSAHPDSDFKEEDEVFIFSSRIISLPFLNLGFGMIYENEVLMKVSCN